MYFKNDKRNKNFLEISIGLQPFHAMKEREQETDRQRQTETDRLADRDRQTGRQIDRNRQKDRLKQTENRLKQMERQID